ncbi:MAG: YggT family protein [Actinomycetes bacterium]
MSEIICTLITIFVVVLFFRAVLSWFPVRPGSGLAQVNRVLVDLTEWALAPVRRIVPQVGMIDISFMVLVFGLLILRGVIC